MSSKHDVVMGHGDDNDGIEEYDNPLPAWWVGLFIICIVWAIGYGLDYHFIRARSQATMYDAEVAAAELRWPKSETPAAAVAVTPEAVASGEEIFKTNCVACHGADMKGGIGPNLVDDEWIHGGSMEQIVATVTKGVPEKGMLSWGPILGDKKVAEVSAYVFQKSQEN